MMQDGYVMDVFEDYPFKVNNFGIFDPDFDLLTEQDRPKPISIYGDFKFTPLPAQYFDIKKVLFKNPATIVFWKDGTKTVVKCQNDEFYDKEKGLAMCFVKKLFGNKGLFNDKLNKWIDPDYRKKRRKEKREKKRQEIS